MTEAQRPQTRADVEALTYNDKQSLAADLGFGRIVGVQEQKLENYIADQLFDEEPAEPPASDDDSEDVVDEDPEPETTEMSDIDTDSDSSEPAPEPETDAISVGHEGKEKPSPAGAPDDGGTAVEPPEGLEDLADARPDDLEADVDDVPEDSAGSSEPAPVDQGETSEDAGEPDGEGSSGGLLSRIRGDSGGESERTSEDIVEAAPTDEARERRREMKQKLESNMAGADPAAGDVGESAGDSGDPSSSETAP